MKILKKRQPLLELAISGRHKEHSLWLLTQSYTAIPNNIRRQAKMLYVWYPKNRTDHEYYSRRERCHRNTRGISEC